MPRYEVTIWPKSPRTVTVEAPNEDDAIYAADLKIAEEGDDGASYEVREVSE